MKNLHYQENRLAAFRIVAIYALIAMIWIYFSDTFLDFLVKDRSILIRISVFKGFLFIAVTALLLYLLIVRLIRKTTDVEKSLRTSQNLINTLVEGTTDAVFVKDREGRYILLNSATAEYIGKKSSEIIGKDDSEIFAPDEADGIMSGDRRVMSRGKVVTYEDYLTSADGAYRIFLSTKGPIFDEKREVTGLFGIARDITERYQAEEIREATITLLRICNEADNKRDLMRELTGFFHRLTGCEAVGVRLRDGDDFPYYETHGFSEVFVLLENSLCAYDQKGELLRDSAGHPAYDCMCGNILSGRFDPSKPFFTPRGSFWSSNTTELLANTTDADRQTKTRNRCNGEGYKSVALVPLRTHGKTFGLFQFNDRRTGRFTAEKIALYEDMVAYVGIALAKILAEEALSESDQFSRQIIDSAEEGIVVYDRELRYQVWNPFMERLTDKKSEEVIGGHPAELFPFLDETGVIENVRKALTGEQLVSAEFFIQSSISGRPHWIYDTCAPFRNTKGEIVGVIGTVRDVTERKRAEEELREASQRLQLAVASGRLGIWDWDIVDDVHYWNDRMYEIYGVSQNDYRISYDAWVECLHPDDRAIAEEEARRAIAGEKEFDLEFRVIQPDGSFMHVKCNASLVRDAAGRAVRMIGITQDVTERKNLEEQLRQAQKMEAIGQLAGGIAHDFNNILTAIYGYCSILQMRVRKEAPLRAEIDQIFSAAEKAANLTRSLLAFSRKQVMTPKTVNLNDIVMNLGKLLNRIIGEDIRMKTEFMVNPLWIFADSGQIEQVLMNLAANARDAMPNGGLLTIETQHGSIDNFFVHTHGFGIPGKYALISVSDTGNGMDAETQKRVFEPFFTTKEMGKGTGLGLAIVYGVVKQHDGFITLNSEPNKGSVFNIYLPLSVAKTNDDAEEESEIPAMGSETVLVAEDDASIRDLVELTLNKFGYNVIIAQDGTEAVEKFKQNREKVDIIVMDLIMPKKSGKETLKEIREIRPGVKSLFMSGYSPDLLQNRGFLDTGEEVMIKPFHSMELLRKVRSILDK